MSQKNNLFVNTKDNLEIRKKFFSKYKLLKETDCALRLKSKLQNHEKPGFISLAETMLQLKDICQNIYCTDLEIFQQSYQSHP